MSNAVGIAVAQYLYVTDPIVAIRQALGVGSLFDLVDQADMDKDLITLRHDRC
jgi:hypothetical protein